MTNTTTTGNQNQKPNVWAIILKVIAAAVATLLGTLGIQSCM